MSRRRTLGQQGLHPKLFGKLTLDSLRRCTTRSIGFCLIVFITAVPLVSQNYPKAKISNGIIHAELMLPSFPNGSYQGTRFDWSGIITSLQFEGHEYFGQWYEHHDPKIHDAITGPVEEFRTNDSALGYDETKPGGAFMRIGIGTVRKPADETAYRPFATYDIVDPGKWTIHEHKDRIEFQHRLKSDDGYAYVYTKTLRIVKGKPRLLIEHTLKNTGEKVIESTQYNHNFLVIDHEVVGPDVVAKFVFTPNPVRGFSDRAEVRGQEIIFPHELQEKGVFTELAGAGTTVKDYDFRLENLKTGAGVHITSDSPLLKVNFWAIRTVAVVEPYIQLRVAPGAETHWTIQYDFYVMPPAAARTCLHGR